ncbi:MAG: polysaccharide biosynthesis protein [Planctomycetales bacterium]|nr:polysaccharide biosynthesis protein [Planctomycetales bacterium]
MTSLERNGLDTVLSAVRQRRVKWTRMLFAVPMFALIYYVVWNLRFDAAIPPAMFNVFTKTVSWVIFVKLASFLWFRVFQSRRQSLTFHDLMALVQASTIATLVLVVVDSFLLTDALIPRSIFLVDWGATIVALGAARAGMRLVEERGTQLLSRHGATPVLIVGANEAGESLLRMLRRSRELPYDVKGFVSNEPQAVGTRIDGVPVLGLFHETCELAKRLRLQDIFIMAGELSGIQVRQLVDDASKRGIAVRVLPSFEHLIHGHVDLQPRQVSITDLLQREPVEIDQSELHKWIDDRVLMVTGSAGSIGSEICRQLLRFAPSRLVVVDRSENGQFFLERELRMLAPELPIDVCIGDGTDEVRMDQIFDRYRPDIVFHAAAYKHVPLMEGNCGEAVKNIVLMTKKLADLASAYDVESFVMISTDKAVNPTSIMGACKRLAELYVQSLAQSSDCRFVTVRFGNVLDSAGSVVPIFREQIARGGPVTVTHPNMTRYFMTIPEASQLVIQAGAMGQGGEIFVLDMGEPVRIVDLARDMIRLSGMKLGEDIEIEFVGTRPGEKLFEELHVDGEHHIATDHKKIMVAESDEINRLEVVRAIKRLGNLTSAPREAIVGELARVIPEFRNAPAMPAPQRRRVA